MIHYHFLTTIWNNYFVCERSHDNMKDGLNQCLIISEVPTHHPFVSYNQGFRRFQETFFTFALYFSSCETTVNNNSLPGLVKT